MDRRQLPQVAPSQTPARLLVVDDEEKIRAHYRRLLSHLGYEVRLAENAAEALGLLEAQTFELILLDLVMPGMGGMGFLKALQRQRQAPPVLLVSGVATVEDGAEAMQLGAHGVVARSSGTRVLLEQIRRLLDLHRDPILAYIRTHCAAIRSREEVADFFHYHPNSVSNQVERHTGLSFHEYLEVCRVQEARRLLAATELEVKEIAARVGFGCAQTLRRAFWRRTGHSPRQYRREIRSAQE